jgi:hypothetical protein
VDRSKEIRAGIPNSNINLVVAKKRKEDCHHKNERKYEKTPSALLLFFSKLS